MFNKKCSRYEEIYTQAEIYNRTFGQPSYEEYTRRKQSAIVFGKVTIMFFAIVFFIVSLFFNQNSFIDVKWFIVSCVFTIVARHMGKIEFENDVVITAYERLNK